MTGECILLDIDGVIADLQHRLHYIQQEPKDYATFYELLVNDKPIYPVIDIMRAISQSHNIVVLTGRSDKYREGTEQWLSHHLGPRGSAWKDCYMRKEGDHRKAYLTKESLLNKIEAAGWRPAVAFEDTPEVVAMLRRRGIITFDVSREHEDHWDLAPEDLAQQLWEAQQELTMLKARLAQAFAFCYDVDKEEDDGTGD